MVQDPAALIRDCSSLFDVFRSAARHFPARGIAIFDSRAKSAPRRTYPEFLDGVRRTAARLAAAGVKPGDRVLVCQPTSWGWVDAWCGALWLKALPVGLAPMGNMAAAASYLEKLEGVMERIGATWLISDAAVRDEARKHGARRTVEAVRTLEELEAMPASAAVPEPHADAEELAFLQLTSGSTGRQRAVMLPHRAALHNTQALDDGACAPHGGHAAARIESVVNWLPLYHDMGLVGTLLYCIANGYDFWLMRPETFLGRPRLWLEALGAHGRALASAPNFAFQQCVERVEPGELAGVDLSLWVGAMDGAEMIRPETCAAFSRKFAACGFRAETFRPCYGLAEASLAVTIDRQGKGVRMLPVPEGAGAGFDLRETVCTGASVLDTQVRIAAPDGSPLPEGRVGQVRAKGPGIFTGYFQDAEATAEALQDGWLCTGDLGFLKDGELYITGRTKDLLIIHGHNVMPHELEWQAESVTGGGGMARCGAFSVTQGTAGEQAVLVVEIEGRGSEALSAVEQGIRSRIGQTLGLPLADVVFVRRGQLPKTTSGKIQRSELRQRYLDGKLERLV